MYIVLLLEEDKKNRKPCSFVVAGGQSLQKPLQFFCWSRTWVYEQPCSFLVAAGPQGLRTTLQFSCWRRTRTLHKNFAALLCEEDKGLQKTLQLCCWKKTRVYKRTLICSLLVEEDKDLQTLLQLRCGDERLGCEQKAGWRLWAGCGATGALGQVLPVQRFGKFGATEPLLHSLVWQKGSSQEG